MTHRFTIDYIYKIFLLFNSKYTPPNPNPKKSATTRLVPITTVIKTHHKPNITKCSEIWGFSKDSQCLQKVQLI